MCSLVVVFIRGTPSTVFPTLLGHPLELAIIISSVISWFFSIYYTNSTLNIIMNLLVNQTVCILHGLDGKYSYDMSSVHLIYKSELASWQIRKRAPWLTPSVSTALFACHKDRANFTHSVHPGYVHACVWGLISCSPQCTSSENRVMLLVLQSSTVTCFSFNKMLYKHVYVCSYINVKFSYNLCFVPTWMVRLTGHQISSCLCTVTSKVILQKRTVWRPK